MYNIDDKEFAIKEVQRFLLIAAEGDERIPKSPIDGIYGDETRAAVIEFQRLSGLPETGVADDKTFSLLYSESVRYNDARRAAYQRYDNGSFPLTLGSYGADVAHLHIVLGELEDYYELNDVPTGDFFTQETKNAVILMQSVFLIEETGIVDEELLERLNNEALYRKKFKK